MMKIYLEKEKADRERADRFNAARSDAIEAFGYTSAVFQRPRREIEANVPRRPARNDTNDPNQEPLPSLSSSSSVGDYYA